MSDYNLDQFGEVPIDDTDLSGLNVEAAKEYVLAFITSLKQTQAQKKQISDQIEVWQGRVQLAKENQRQDLVLEAEQTVEGLKTEYAGIETEESELQNKVTVLTENLKKLKATYVEYSVDAEQLLADITMLVGEKDTLSDTFKQEQAESDLAKLKQKMQNGEETGA